MGKKFSHLDSEGSARMVDVGDKVSTRRKAVASCIVRFSPETFRRLLDHDLPKGDVFTVARIAGIQAAKQTASLIPLCHPLPLDAVDITFTPDHASASVTVLAEARTTAATGVEMEALAGALVAALTMYDMCKAVQKDIVIDACRLLAKSGGRSGTYTAGS